VDALSRAVMGDKMFAAFTAYKKDEWRRYHTHVSDWELNQYLRFF
jgi:glutamine synthetase